MFSIQEFLFNDGFLSLREVMRLVLLSGLFTIVCLMAFPRNAPSRRIFVLAGLIALATLPWVLASFDAVWLLPVDIVPSITLKQFVPNAILLAWLFIAGIVLAVHVRQVVQEVSALNRLTQVTKLTVRGQFCLDLVEEMAQILETSSPSVRIGAHACSTTLGRRLLILPEEYTLWDETTLRSVIAHELVHISRRDDMWLLLARGMVLFYWWMPWLMLMYQAYVRVMEESCDDAASELTGQKLGYVSALVDASGMRQPSTLGDELMYRNVANMHQHHLVGRVGRFAHVREVEADTGGIYWAVLAILTIVIVLTGIQPVAQISYSMTADQHAAWVYEPIEPSPQVEPVVYPRVIRGRLIANNDLRHSVRYLSEPEYLAQIVYPGVAIRAQVEGEVLAEYVVNTDGSVAQIRIVSSRPGAEFDKSVIRALKNTRYKPRHHRGRLELAVQPKKSTFVQVTSANLNQRYRDHSVGLRLPSMPLNQPLQVKQQFSFRLHQGGGN